LPNDDDEIVDQALMIDRLAGPRLTLLTYDTGMSTRARGASVKCHKFVHAPEGEEPART
jgi:hypothetical protein